MPSIPEPPVGSPEYQTAKAIVNLIFKGSTGEKPDLDKFKESVRRVLHNESDYSQILDFVAKASKRSNDPDSVYIQEAINAIQERDDRNIRLVHAAAERIKTRDGYESVLDWLERNKNHSAAKAIEDISYQSEHNPERQMFMEDFVGAGAVENDVVNFLENAQRKGHKITPEELKKVNSRYFDFLLGGLDAAVDRLDPRLVSEISKKLNSARRTKVLTPDQLSRAQRHMQKVSEAIRDRTSRTSGEGFSVGESRKVASEFSRSSMIEKGVSLHDFRSAQMRTVGSEKHDAGDPRRPSMSVSSAPDAVIYNSGKVSFNQPDGSNVNMERAYDYNKARMEDFILARRAYQRYLGGSVEPWRGAKKGYTAEEKAAWEAFQESQGRIRNSNAGGLSTEFTFPTRPTHNGGYGIAVHRNGFIALGMPGTVRGFIPDPENPRLPLDTRGLSIDEINRARNTYINYLNKITFDRLSQQDPKSIVRPGNIDFTAPLDHMNASFPGKIPPASIVNAPLMTRYDSRTPLGLELLSRIARNAGLPSPVLNSKGEFGIVGDKSEFVLDSEVKPGLSPFIQETLRLTSGGLQGMERLRSVVAHVLATSPNRSFVEQLIRMVENHRDTLNRGAMGLLNKGSASSVLSMDPLQDPNSLHDAFDTRIRELGGDPSHRVVPVNVDTPIAAAPSDAPPKFVPGQRIQNWFSNMVPFDTPMVHEGIEYRTPENYFQAMKSQDPATRARIAALPPGTAKTEGRKVPISGDWNQTKDRVMMEALRHKFSPGTDQGKRLNSTTGEIVEYNNWHDNIWGHCVCPRCANLPKENRLGKMLTQIRDENLGVASPANADPAAAQPSASNARTFLDPEFDPQKLRASHYQEIRDYVARENDMAKELLGYLRSKVGVAAETGDYVNATLKHKDPNAKNDPRFDERRRKWFADRNPEEGFQPQWSSDKPDSPQSREMFLKYFVNPQVEKGAFKRDIITPEMFEDPLFGPILKAQYDEYTRIREEAGFRHSFDDFIEQKNKAAREFVGAGSGNYPRWSMIRSDGIPRAEFYHDAAVGVDRTIGRRPKGAASPDVSLDALNATDYQTMDAGNRNARPTRGLDSLVAELEGHGIAVDFEGGGNQWALERQTINRADPEKQYHGYNDGLDDYRTKYVEHEVGPHIMGGTPGFRPEASRPAFTVEDLSRHVVLDDPRQRALWSLVRAENPGGLGTDRFTSQFGGTRWEEKLEDGTKRRISVHTPGSLAYQLNPIPGRLDVTRMIPGFEGTPQEQAREIATRQLPPDRWQASTEDFKFGSDYETNPGIRNMFNRANRDLLVLAERLRRIRKTVNDMYIMSNSSNDELNPAKSEAARREYARLEAVLKQDWPQAHEALRRGIQDASHAPMSLEMQSKLESSLRRPWRDWSLLRMKRLQDFMNAYPNHSAKQLAESIMPSLLNDRNVREAFYRRYPYLRTEYDRLTGIRDQGIKARNDFENWIKLHPELESHARHIVDGGKHIPGLLEEFTSNFPNHVKDIQDFHDRIRSGDYARAELAKLDFNHAGKFREFMNPEVFQNITNLMNQMYNKIHQIPGNTPHEFPVRAIPTPIDVVRSSYAYPSGTHQGENTGTRQQYSGEIPIGIPYEHSAHEGIRYLNPESFPETYKMEEYWEPSEIKLGNDPVGDTHGFIQTMRDANGNVVWTNDPNADRRMTVPDQNVEPRIPGTAYEEVHAPAMEGKSFVLDENGNKVQRVASRWQRVREDSTGVPTINQNTRSFAIPDMSRADNRTVWRILGDHSRRMLASEKTIRAQSAAAVQSLINESEARWAAMLQEAKLRNRSYIDTRVRSLEDRKVNMERRIRNDAKSIAVTSEQVEQDVARMRAVIDAKIQSELGKLERMDASVEATHKLAVESRYRPKMEYEARKIQSQAESEVRRMQQQIHAEAGTAIEPYAGVNNPFRDWYFTRKSIKRDINAMEVEHQANLRKMQYEFDAYVQPLEMQIERLRPEHAALKQELETAVFEKQPSSVIRRIQENINITFSHIDSIQRDILRAKSAHEKKIDEITKAFNEDVKMRREAHMRIGPQGGTVELRNPLPSAIPRLEVRPGNPVTAIRMQGIQDRATESQLSTPIPPEATLGSDPQNRFTSSPADRWSVRDYIVGSPDVPSTPMQIFHHQAGQDYRIVSPNGTINVGTPKVKQRGDKNTMYTWNEALVDMPGVGVRVPYNTFLRNVSGSLANSGGGTFLNMEPGDNAIAMREGVNVGGEFLPEGTPITFADSARFQVNTDSPLIPRHDSKLIHNPDWKPGASSRYRITPVSDLNNVDREAMNARLALAARAADPNLRVVDQKYIQEIGPNGRVVVRKMQPSDYAAIMERFKKTASEAAKHGLGGYKSLPGVLGLAMLLNMTNAEAAGHGGENSDNASPLWGQLGMLGTAGAAYTAANPTLRNAAVSGARSMYENLVSKPVPTLFGGVKKVGSGLAHMGVGMAGFTAADLAADKIVESKFGDFRGPEGEDTSKRLGYDLAKQGAFLAADPAAWPFIVPFAAWRAGTYVPQPENRAYEHFTPKDTSTYEGIMGQVDPKFYTDTHFGADPQLQAALRQYKYKNDTSHVESYFRDKLSKDMELFGGGQIPAHMFRGTVFKMQASGMAPTDVARVMDNLFGLSRSGVFGKVFPYGSEFNPYPKTRENALREAESGLRGDIAGMGPEAAIGSVFMDVFNPVSKSEPPPPEVPREFSFWEKLFPPQTVEEAYQSRVSPPALSDDIYKVYNGGLLTALKSRPKKPQLTYFPGGL